MFPLDTATLAAIGSIVVIDLVLSGDNAVVIGMAASQLREDQRRKAVILGAAAAIGLRVLFTALAAVLLGVPLLQLIGGLMLAWIALKLLRPHATGHGGVKVAASPWEAIRTIALADVVMSLDNILAVGGAAHGSLALLIFGLALSMPLITIGSGLVAWTLDRLPWVVYVGSGVLAWTAGQMMVDDPYFHGFLEGLSALELALPAALTVAVLAIGWMLRRRTGGEDEPRGRTGVRAFPIGTATDPDEERAAPASER
jgi:YjbE family integral membrane protein